VSDNDIVARLLALHHPDAADGADEIERLREAGDAMAEALRVNQGAGPAAAFMSDRALTAWKEARRG
jgi:hypothetical protein